MSTAAAASAAPIAQVSDIALLRRYSDQRDDSAYAEIVRRYAGMVYAACFRVLHDRQLAEDAAQETFLKLMRRPGSVSLSVGGWLHRAATQLAIDVSRSESARRRREKAHSLQKAEELDDQRSWREISESIDGALIQLPEEARDLLVQHFIRGRSQKELADERNVSVATICRRVGDAMEQLRGILRRGGMGMSVALLVGDFLALRGTESIPLTLQQELGKMSLLAGVNRGWRMVRPVHRSGLNFWQVKELELAAVVIVGAALVVLGVLLMLGPRGHKGQTTQPSDLDVAASLQKAADRGK